ncbi:SRPBCC family protein [Burkholderia pseudomultivorans]|uniref:SRPBCC family protein n=1 Tax=Burkholderia pseudomultivorans TaxID=1207504 RepID=UPI000753EB5D|nr:SRPBCC domain-containing protein [Burkholderia pseudomultivorans]KWI56105.1 polyketide cyclase [Burkholderia pseudomultivorans]MBF5009782.1 SRPBCC domain-containing protein [Burkholderia pseudomultivorans]
MNPASTEMRSVVVERTLPHAPEKIWRALTQPHLLEAWLMQSDFEPVEGRAFSFRADWGAVDCKVLTIEPQRTLSYTWAAYGLDSVVTWTLEPTPDGGTRLRMEQVGFRADQEQAYRGAQHGWGRFLDALEQLLSRPGEGAEARS